MYKILILSIFGLAFSVTHGSPERIVGGVATTIEEYPFMVRMDYDYWNSLWYHTCAGTLVSRNAVLSAAHCYFSDPEYRWQAVVGTSYRLTGGIVHAVRRLYVHPEFVRGQFDYDVALIELVTPVTLSETVSRAMISGKQYQIADNEEVTAIGWGLVDGGLYASELHKTDVEIINQETCRQRHLVDSADITKRNICSGILDLGGKGHCSGDSGAPLVHNNVVIGISSWDTRCGNAFYPHINLRVSEVSDWIVYHVIRMIYDI